MRADDGRDQGPEAEEEQHQRQHARGGGALVAVPDDGARDDESGRGGHAVQEAEPDQHLDGVRDRTAERRDRGQQQPRRR